MWGSIPLAVRTNKNYTEHEARRDSTPVPHWSMAPREPKPHSSIIEKYPAKISLERGGAPSHTPTLTKNVVARGRLPTPKDLIITLDTPMCGMRIKNDKCRSTQPLGVAGRAAKLAEKKS